MSVAANLAHGFLVAGLAWAAAAAQASAQNAPAETLIIVHANVIDGRADAPLMDATVVVVDGRIQSVGHGETPGQQGRVIDLSGHWLLPGFVDAHVHVGDIAAARRALESGATTIAS
jgi:imidazolonepropionase-like amidohydrolase